MYCIFRPPGTVVLTTRRSYVLLLFFVSFSFWHFEALYLQPALADRCETLARDWTCVHLDNVGRKIVGEPPTKFFWGSCFFLHLGPKSPSYLHWSPVKLCQMMGNMWSS